MVLVLSLVLSGVVTYLMITTLRWQDHSTKMDITAHQLGTVLADTRSDLEGTVAQLELVSTQLASAQQRLIALANEKAQVADISEYRQQLLDYQVRVTDAASEVATKLEQCVSGQQQIIGELITIVNTPPVVPIEDPDATDPAPPTATPPADPLAPLAQLRLDVAKVCEEASEANEALQEELAK